MEAILEKERALTRRLWEGLAELKGVKLYGTIAWIGDWGSFLPTWRG